MDNKEILEKLENDYGFSINHLKGGYFDLPKDETCKDPSHNPPTNIHIPQGKGYVHVCPSCGKRHVIIPPQVSF